jgi:Domain of unknown function (DUF5666)
MNVQRFTAAILCMALSAGCTQLQNQAALSGAQVCATQASLTNPLAAEPGLGGTGQVAQNPGLGGTGQVAQRPGIGGTGQVAQRPGIGGTGISSDGGIGGTGIVGVVTGFASICVNGVELHYDASTPVLRDGQAAPARDLLVGQVVAVRASGSGASADQLQAQQIAVLDAAVGPLTRVDPATGELELLGQRAVALERSDLVRMRVGDWVRVSGHRLLNGEIRASRVQAMEQGAGTAQGTVAAQVLGPVSAINGNQVRVGGTLVSFELQAPPAGLAVGQELAVSGAWNGSRLQAQRASTQPTREGLGKVENVVLQGYVHALRGRELQLGYESLQLSDRLQVSGGKAEQLQVGQRVQISGRVGADQRITAERVQFSRESSRSSSGNEDGDDSGGRGRNRGRGGSGSSDGSDDSGSGSGKGSSGSGSGSSGSGSGSGGGGSGSGSGGGGGSGSGGGGGK